jgi:CarboxypepD_reg-like domain
MRFIKKNLLFVLLLCMGIAANAQERTVTGTVTSDGKALAGVTILIKGEKTGYTTNADGSYSIKVPQGNVTLVFSFIGYASQVVTVKNQPLIDVVLVADNKSLDDVVVIGYGTQKKRDLTGAVSSVKAKDHA